MRKGRVLVLAENLWLKKEEPVRMGFYQAIYLEALDSFPDRVCEIFKTYRNLSERG
ncbi:MAG: hypothetical protein ACI9DC_002787 [Gammaproteobacteria bacterium]|jgi:hypothetical protein